MPVSITNWYDVVILSKIKCNAYVIPFQSRMQRKLMYITILNKSNELIKIGTVHLESLNNQNTRENQLILSYKALDSLELDNKFLNCRHTFVLGDFNFTEKETSLIQENGYIDAGNEILKKSKNYKQDFIKWCTMKEMKGYPAWRPDRFTYKTTSKSFAITHFELVGKNKISNPDNTNPVNTPSDHYGLYVECNL